MSCVCDALFRNGSVLEHDDSVRHANGGKSMRDQQRHFAVGESAKRWKTSYSDRASSAAVGSSRISSCASRNRRGRAQPSAIRHLKGRGRLRSACRATARNRSEAGESPRPPGSSVRPLIYRFVIGCRCGQPRCCCCARHLVAHEVLKDDTDLAVQVFDAVIPQINAVEQNTAVGRIVEAGNQFDDRRLALAILADQGDPFARFDA